MRDTSEEMTKKMHEMIQKKSPSERLKMGSSMYETSKYLVTRAIKEKNPTISIPDLRKELFLAFYADDFTPEQQEKIILHLSATADKDEPQQSDALD